MTYTTVCTTVQAVIPQDEIAGMVAVQLKRGTTAATASEMMGV